MDEQAPSMKSETSKPNIAIEFFIIHLDTDLVWQPVSPAPWNHLPEI
jgi:hypothetical protein